MLVRLLFLFISIPLVELALLLWIAKETDLWFTLALVLVTGFVGAWLARLQGWHTYVRIQRDINSGRMPTDSLVDAVMIFVAGALLLTPGVLTDALGISLLLPTCRRFYRWWLKNWFQSRFEVHAMVDRKPPMNDRIIDSYVVRRGEEESSDRIES